MSASTVDRLRNNFDRISELWSARAMKEIAATRDRKGLALWSGLPDYLRHLADALSKTIDRTEARRIFDFNEAARIGKQHGGDRAGQLDYTIDQVIGEYHVLRQVIFDVLEEEEAVLAPKEREIIVCSLEQAVSDAATQFSDTLRDIQEKFTHTLAHDLRNPISAAKLSAQMILRRPEDAAYSTKAAGRICVSMNRLDSMIHDLLDASRIRAGQNLPLQFEDCDLDLIAQQVTDEFNFKHPNRFVIRSVGECVGYWNENGIRRVLENLAANAVKHGAPGSPVTVTIRRTAEQTTISFHNEGRAIPASERETLFEQFRHVRAPGARSGWGLGLTVVKGLAEAHHGSVEVESEEGRGTLFTVRLPNDWRRLEA